MSNHEYKTIYIEQLTYTRKLTESASYIKSKGVSKELRVSLEFVKLVLLSCKSIVLSCNSVV